MTTETTTEAPVAEAAQAAPVADVVDATSAAQTPEQMAEAAAKARDDKGRFSKPPEERIAEVTRKMREQEREAAYWRGRATAREQAEAVKTAEVAKPTADKFDTYDAYIEALTEWKADQIVDTKLTKRDTAAAEKAKAETRAKTWNERLDEATKAIPDYHEVMESAADLR